MEAELQPESDNLSSGVEETSADSFLEGVQESEGLQEGDQESYNSLDLASMDAEKFQELETKVFTPEAEKEPESEVKPEETIEAESQSEQAQEEVSQGKQNNVDPFSVIDENDPQLKGMLDQVNRSYQSYVQQEQTLIQRYNQLKAKAEEIAEDNPRGAVQLDREIEKLEAEYQRVQGEKQTLQIYASNLSVVPRRVPKQFLDPELIAREVQDTHGFSPEQAREYAQKAMYNRPANEVIALAHLAFYGDALRRILPEYQRLVAAQGNGTQAKPKSANEVAKMINKAKAVPKTLKPAVEAPPVSSISTKQLASMSDEQFEILTKQVLDNGRI